jgi:hypothetical protein
MCVTHNPWMDNPSYLAAGEYARDTWEAAKRRGPPYSKLLPLLEGQPGLKVW